MSLRNLKQYVSSVDIYLAIAFIGIILLLFLLLIVGVFTDNTSDKGCVNRKIINVINVNKDYYRTTRVGKVTTMQQHEIEYVRVILDDYTTWEARYEDLDHDVVVGNTLSNKCGKNWDKK